MINFNKNSVWNLKPIDVSAVRSEVTGLLVFSEEIVCAFKTIRDQLVFTNKRRHYRNKEIIFLFAIFKSSVFCNSNSRRYGNGP